MLNKLIAFCDTLRETLLLYVIIVLLSSAALTVFEGWSYFESFYTAIVTSLSVGYGDFSPKTTGGRLTAVLLMVSTLMFVIPMIVAHLLSVIVKNRHEFTHEEQEQIKSLLSEINTKLGGK